MSDESTLPAPSGPDPAKRVSVPAKLNLFLATVFGSLLVTCCVGSLILRRFDATVEVTDAASIQEVVAIVPSVALPPMFKPTKAASKESMFGSKAQVVQWETPGGTKFIMGQIDLPFDPEADPGRLMKELPITNPLGISYDFLKDVLPSTSVEINGTIVQLRVASIDPNSREGSVIGIFPTKDKKTGIIYVKTNAADVENMVGVEELLKTIK